MKVSVIIPTRGRSVRNVVASLTCHAYPHLEDKKIIKGNELETIIVVDGESSIEMEPGIRKSANVKVVMLPHSGPARARNYGAEMAQGEYLFFTNDDVMVNDLCLEAHCLALSNGDKIATIGDTELAHNRYKWLLRKLGLGGYEYSMGFNSFSTINLGIAKRHFKPFDEGFPYAAFEDNELGYRLMKDGLQLVYVPEAKAFHYHEYTLKEIVKRQYEMGYSLAYMLELHPELRKVYKEPRIWNYPKWRGFREYEGNAVEERLI